MVASNNKRCWTRLMLKRARVSGSDRPMAPLAFCTPIYKGEKERHQFASGKSACFDVEAVVEIEGVRAGPTRSHIVLRNLRIERSKTRTGSGASDSSIGSGASSDFELALVFEKPGRYTLPIHDITRIRCKHLHQGKASIEARDSLFILTAASQNELERLLETIRDVKILKILADSRLCAACKEKGERKKDKQKREQQQPTGFVPSSRLDEDCQATKKARQAPEEATEKVKVLDCIFRKKQLPSLVETGQEQVHLKDLLRRRDRDEAPHKLKKMGMSPPEGSDTRPIEIDEEIYGASFKNDGISAEGMKHNNGFRYSPPQTKAREAPIVKPISPTRKAIFIDAITRRNVADLLRRKEAQRIVAERKRDIEKGVSVRSSDNEKENFDVDEDVRKSGEETVKVFAEERRGVDEVLRKVQEGQRRVDDENRRNEERRTLEVEERRRAEQNSKNLRRKETLRKLVELESKRKDEWEAKRQADRKWQQEEDEKKLKADEDRYKKSLDRRLQEEDRRREEYMKEEENRKDEERRKKCLERIMQEEKRRRLEEDKRLEELKKREEDNRAREADRKLQELKQKEEEEKRAKEAERKVQEQMQEQMRKQAEEKVQEALKYFKMEENRHELRDQEELRKFQEAVKNTIRLSQRYRTRISEDPNKSTEESKNILEEQRDKLDQRKLDEDMRKWRAEENYRRAKEVKWTMPDHDRLNLEEQRKRVEAVMQMSKRLNQKMGGRVEAEVEERKQAADATEEYRVHKNSSPEGTRSPDDDEAQNRGFHESVAFLDQFLSFRDNQKACIEEEIRLGKEGERFNLSDIFARPARTRQEEEKKQELQRKKAAKAADDLKKKLAQERLKAAKVEAKRLEKLLKEAQKRAKAEERVRQQQKAQEQARQKAAAAHASARGTQLSGISVVQLTYQQYEDLWNVMKLSARSAILGYSDIPWPPHDNPLFVEPGDSVSAQRRKLRIALLRWHPDKFMSLCGNRLSPSERECIEARAKILAQEVIQWKSKLDSIS